MATQVTLNSGSVDSAGSLSLKTNGTTTAVTIGTDQSVNFAATGQRITGDFSNATVANRVMFQSSTTNGYTSIGAIPNGTSVQSFISAYNNSDPTNASAMQIDCGSTGAFVRSNIAGTGTYLPMIFQTGGSERVRVDTSGNVGIGTSSPVGRLGVVVSGTGDQNILSLGTTGGGGQGLLLGVNTTNSVTTIKNNTGAYGMAFYSGTGTSESMRIDSSGNLLVGTTDTAFSSGVGAKFSASSTTPSMGYVVNTAGNHNTYHFYNTNATNNGFRFYVNINGGIYNFSGNNSNLSDERKKTNIELSGNYLDKICAIPVKLFNYKDEPTGEQRTLGVIAQDVEAVAPELVNNEGFGETPEGEAPLKSVYTTDMMFALMKCIQEQQAIIQTLTDRITALEQA